MNCVINKFKICFTLHTFVLKIIQHTFKITKDYV